MLEGLHKTYWYAETLFTRQGDERNIARGKAQLINIARKANLSDIKVSGNGIGWTDAREVIRNAVRGVAGH